MVLVTLKLSSLLRSPKFVWCSGKLGRFRFSSGPVRVGVSSAILSLTAIRKMAILTALRLTKPQVGLDSKGHRRLPLQVAA